MNAVCVEEAATLPVSGFSDPENPETRKPTGHPCERKLTTGTQDQTLLLETTKAPLKLSKQGTVGRQNLVRVDGKSTHNTKCCLHYIVAIVLIDDS